MTYSTFDVPVSGGPMRVGRWSATSDERVLPTIVAIHGITAHHLTWPLLAQDLPEADVVAPDLRGRGRSRDLPLPTGLAVHADDVAAVVRQVGGPAIVVGHSMGGFVATVLLHRHPDLVAGLVLVDGGFPFAPAEQDTTQAGLAQIRARLEAEFPSAEAYVDLFRSHPAFTRDRTEALDDYARYDVIGQAPHCHASAVLEAVVTDQTDIMEGSDLAEAVQALATSDVPAVFLRAPRGFVDDPPGLYAAETAQELQRQFPSVEFRDVPDVNHYTILLAPHGAAAVADAVRTVAGS